MRKRRKEKSISLKVLSFCVWKTDAGEKKSMRLIDCDCLTYLPQPLDLSGSLFFPLFPISIYLSRKPSIIQYFRSRTNANQCGE